MNEEGALAEVAPVASGTPTAVRLLGVDPDFGAGLGQKQRAEAERHVVLPGVQLGPGPLTLDGLRQAHGVSGELLGFLIVDGALAMRIDLADRICARWIGSLELVLLDGRESDSIPSEWSWSVLAPTTLALFDQRLLVIAQRWPTLLSTILKRAAMQTRHAFLQQAVSQLPRVEERLLALFWTIADRVGIVSRDGIRVELPATHEMLAHMIGAQRPTVSLGLTRLAEAGLLQSDGDFWLLNPESADKFGAKHTAFR